MRKTISHPSTSKSTERHLCRISNGGGVALLFLVVALLCVATPDSVAAAEKGQALPESAGVEREEPVSDARTIKMTQQEFDEFLRQRKHCQQMVRGLSDETCIPAMTEIRKKSCRPFIHVQLPDRRVAFSSRRIIIRLDRSDSRRFVETLPYFPEINAVFVYYGDDSGANDVYRPMPYEATPVPNWLLDSLRKLPNLDMLVFQGGTFSTEAMATIAEYPSLRELGLGRCRVTKDGFAELVKLKTLESLSVIAGLTSDCFVTLAKLPHFREFYFWGATDDFNKPIDDETRRAIESLNGRLERFGTSETAATIHASIVQALLKVKSLKELDIDSVGRGLTLSDVQQLEDFPDLTRLNLSLFGICPQMTERDFLKARAIIWKVEKRAQDRAEKERQQKNKSQP